MHTILTSGSVHTTLSADRENTERPLVVDPLAREVHLRGQRIELTRTEFDLLHLLSSRPRQVFTPRQLFQDIWTEEFFDADHVVETHISRLRRKLGESGIQPRHIHTVRGVGYRFEPDPPGPVAHGQTDIGDGIGTTRVHRVRLTPDLSVTEIDPGLAEILGVTGDECLGQRFPELVKTLAGSILLEIQTRPLHDGMGRLVGIEVRVVARECTSSGPG